MGCGFLGTNIHPGQVHMLVNTNMHSSKQLIHPGLKRDWVCSLKAVTKSFTGWKECLKEGHSFLVNFKCFRMDSKRCFDIYSCKQKGAPEKMSGLSFAQNIRLGIPWVVANKKRKARNRRNSSHVRGSERDSFVAVMTVVLMKSMGKKWRK